MVPKFLEQKNAQTERSSLKRCYELRVNINYLVKAKMQNSELP